ncbi:MAG TPA: hypothetical protein VNT81_04340 [Vicinamibacterales bacterium]|nr:hypothetical protein [Vicinamibacterales bacterium]
MSRFLPLLFVASIALAPPSEVQAQSAIDQTTRLASLGRVWGLVKYFHPGVTGGGIDWDAALIEAIPRVKAAQTKGALNEELLRLVRAAGPEPRLAAGVSADQPETDPHFAWLNDSTLFEPSTMQALKTVRRATVPLTSRYVRPVPNVSNPDFSAETAWTGGALPNEEQRLLALFRYWNIVQYYFPSRDITDRPWSTVLAEEIPRFIAAADALTYHLAGAALIASINDTHGSTSSPTLTAHWGVNVPAIRTRYIESRTVVTRIFDRYIGGAEVRVGDVIESINGVPVDDLRARIAPYVASSNPAALQRVIDGLLLRTTPPR